MRIEFSKELMGLALLTLVWVLLVKGFFWGWFQEIQTMRGEIATLTSLGREQHHPQRLQLLQSRLDQARLIKQKAESRWQVFSLGDLPLHIDNLASETQVKIQALANEEDGEPVWRLNLSGNAEQLTRFLHQFESNGLPVLITEVILKRGRTTEMEVFFEVAP